MKAGYCMVNSQAFTAAAGKIRKIRCSCNGPDLINSQQYEKGTEEGNSYKYCNYFNHGETGLSYKDEDRSSSDCCPICKSYAWYTI